MTWVRSSFLRYHARSKRDKSKTRASSNENYVLSTSWKRKTPGLERTTGTHTKSSRQLLSQMPSQALDATSSLHRECYLGEEEGRAPSELSGKKTLLL